MIISNVQRFSVHDGPGIRTTVFFKGCNLRCDWCHNPEAILPDRQMQFFADRCIGCGACLAVCSQQAHRLTNGDRQFDRALCTTCGSCASVCYPKAMVPAGREMTVDQVMKEIVADKEFYESSGGGVTLSGGEPLVQLESALAILKACKAERIHTAIETNLAWPWSHVAATVPWTDLFMVDVKLMDASAHERWTGTSNEQILANARQLSAAGVPMIVRTPVVAGVNATTNQIGCIADFVASVGNVLYYELLPYHPLGTHKYAALGMDRPASEFNRLSDGAMGQLMAEARMRGIEVRCAGVRAEGGEGE